MKILIVNPIVYTSETKEIKQVETIQDTMIYSLCMAYHKKGFDVTLAAAKEFKPTNTGDIPFKIVWMKSYFKNIFTPHNIPCNLEIIKIIKATKYDYIITSEVFSIDTLLVCMKARKKVIIWQELAKHNKLFKKIPSKIWYSLVARILLRNNLVVARSIEAKEFISKYCSLVSDEIIDHGVDLSKFILTGQKSDYFVVSSQLIKRKRVDLIINKFGNFINKYEPNYKLLIMGEGQELGELRLIVQGLHLESNVIFTGKLDHEVLKEYLAKASALLVNTEKDNNMISIVESIAVGTPIITTSIPYNSSYIKANSLGIVNDFWDENSLRDIIMNNDKYVKNCIGYRSKISTERKVDEFNFVYRKYLC